MDLKNGWPKIALYLPPTHILHLTLNLQLEGLSSHCSFPHTIPLLPVTALAPSGSSLHASLPDPTQKILTLHFSQKVEVFSPHMYKDASLISVAEIQPRQKKEGKGKGEKTKQNKKNDFCWFPKEAL